MGIRLKIKQCPFCGEKAKIYWNNVWDYGVVKCDACGATTGRFDYDKSAIKAWNKRAQPEFTPDELDAIRRMFADRYPRTHKLPEIEQSIIDKCAKVLKGGRAR